MCRRMSIVALLAAAFALGGLGCGTEDPLPSPYSITSTGKGAAYQFGKGVISATTVGPDVCEFVVCEEDAGTP